MDLITLDEFRKIEIRIGKVLKVEKVENTDKLLKLQIDFGPEIGERQIVSGIAEYYQPAELEGKKLPFIVNLEPRKFKGEESQGMLMAIDSDPPVGEASKPVFLIPQEDVAEGSEVV